MNKTTKQEVPNRGTKESVNKGFPTSSQNEETHSSVVYQKTNREFPIFVLNKPPFSTLFLKENQLGEWKYSKSLHLTP
jgi:hypothetical protein